MRWLDSITDSMDMNSRKCREILEEEEPELLQSMGSQTIEYDLVTEQQIYMYTFHSKCSHLQ